MTSLETPQGISLNVISSSHVTCTWNITSPRDSRIVVEFKDEDDLAFIVWSGLYSINKI